MEGGDAKAQGGRAVLGGVVAADAHAACRRCARADGGAAAAWTNAARSMSVVRPTASNVRSRAFGLGGTTNHTVRAIEVRPRQGTTAPSRVASTSSAVAWRSIGNPLRAE